MAYVDGFLIPVPRKNIAAYKKMSEQAGKFWIAQGALDYKECVGDDLFVQGMASSFPGALKLKRGETLIFSWAVYKDKAHRDRVNKAIQADPSMMPPKKMPFDPARMLFGGFDVLVDMQPKRKPARKAAKKAKKAR